VSQGVTEFCQEGPDPELVRSSGFRVRWDNTEASRANPKKNPTRGELMRRIGIVGMVALCAALVASVSLYAQQ
jgi:hypothetical protein